MHWAGITAILLYRLPCPVRSGPGPGPGSRAHCTRIVDGKKIGLTTTRAQPQTRYFESLAFTWPLREKLSEKLAFLAHAFLAAGASTVTATRPAARQEVARPALPRTTLRVTVPVLA